MPRYFFSIHDGNAIYKDDEGVELAGHEDARTEALRILPDLARDEINGDHRTYLVLVSDDAGQPIYSATLSYAGLWLAEAEST